MKKILLAGTVLATVAGGWLYQTPYAAVDRLTLAVQQRDMAELNRRIDFPAVRESLKVSLGDTLSTTLLGQPTDSGMKAIAGMFAAAMVNPVVDSLVTPEGLSLLLKADMPDPKGAPDQPVAQDSDVRIDKRYDDFKHFRMTVTRTGTPKVTVHFVFERDGLSDWKLREVSLPVASAAKAP